jgi:hypothetical protein
MSVISAGTTLTTALVQTGDTNGNLVFKTGASGTTALTLGSDQSATFAGGISLGALTTSGNLTFTGTGNRILGDFSNATVANRVAFQTSTTNSSTVLTAYPNGTGNTTGLNLYNGTDPLNSNISQIAVTSIDTRIAATAVGTATPLPMIFLTGGSERLRIDTSGNVGIGTSGASEKFQVNTGTTYAATFNSTVTTDTTTRLSIGAFSNSAAGSGGSVAIGSSHNHGATAISSMVLYTHNGTSLLERMRIDASGNVGIGTSSPTALLHVAGSARIGNSEYNTGTIELNVQGSGDRNTFIDFHSSGTPAASDFSARIIKGAGANSDFGIVNTGAGSIVFENANAERMRVNGAGNLLVGTTTSLSGTNTQLLQVASTIATRGYLGFPGVNGTGYTNPFNINWTGSPQLWIDSVNVGTISVSSDYRIKRNIETQTAPALERVMALRPVTYQMADYGTLFKETEEIKEGFIAHEVQEVIPSGAEGFKDDPEQIQSLRVDAILAVAVKAIQELNAKVTALEAQLENK